MYLLYLDDSGSPANPKEDYFVLGGVCVPEKSLRWLSYEIEKLAINIEASNSNRVEFHAAEIYNGKTNPWKPMKRIERIEIIQNVLQTLDKANSGITLFATAIHKKSYPKEDVVIKAYEDISSRFDMYLNRISTKRDHELGMIILDKTSYETGLQQLARSIRNQGNKWGSNLRGICEVPMFADSKASRILQLADHIAYSVFRRYNADDLKYFNCIEGRFDQDNGIMHGLTHMQLETPNCTCPACLTRRIKRD